MHDKVASVLKNQDSASRIINLYSTDMSGQLHVPTALSPEEKCLQNPVQRRTL